MKKTFLRILPLAAAVLLATSCSKDENNDNAVVNNGQETVQTKTLPISITVNQKGLSKLSCTGDMGADLQPIFEAGDKLAIYKGETFVKNLEVTADKISAGGKTATFEGEISADGLVDGQTVLTAKIGTPITAAVTATSRENAVKSGCYQTATFTYSSTGNNITLEEQNAYIEVVWTNKGGATVPFTIGDETVPLTLNGQGQGWIVLPAGQLVTCAALGITEAKTTAKGNIYGITREFSAVPEGYVDLDVTVGDQHIYFEKSESYTPSSWTDLQNENKLGDLPTKDEWTALKEQCYWVWDDTEDHKGYYVYKVHDQSDANKITHEPTTEYSTANDPFIFLPVLDGGDGYYWSGEPNDGDNAFCLNFTESGGVFPYYPYSKGDALPVVTVSRSSN
jgi:hypothetical protein